MLQPMKEVQTQPTPGQIIMQGFLLRLFELTTTKAQTPIEAMLVKKMTEALMHNILTAPRSMLAEA